MISEGLGGGQEGGRKWRKGGLRTYANLCFILSSSLVLIRTIHCSLEHFTKGTKHPQPPPSSKGSKGLQTPKTYPKFSGLNSYNRLWPSHWFPLFFPTIKKHLDKGYNTVNFIIWILTELWRHAMQRDLEKPDFSLGFHWYLLEVHFNRILLILYQIWK